MDPILDQYTSVDESTVTCEQLAALVPATAKVLSPRQANMLSYQITEKLMVGNCDRQALKLVARWLSQESFADLVEERVVNHHCGYPLCKYQDDRIKEVQLNRLVTTLKMPGSYNNKYCCRSHYQCAEFYKRQLSEEPLFMRIHMDAAYFGPGTPESRIVLLEEVFEAKHNEANGSAQMRELLSLMDGLELDEPASAGFPVVENISL